MPSVELENLVKVGRLKQSRSFEEFEGLIRNAARRLELEAIDERLLRDLLTAAAEILQEIQRRGADERS